jgi:hypothetical protein
MSDTETEVPPPPDYTELIALQTSLAQQSQVLAQQQFDWAVSAYEADKAITDQISASLIDSMEQQQDWAAADRERYESVFVPLQDQFVQDASAWDDYVQDFEGYADEYKAGTEDYARDLEEFDTEERRSQAMAEEGGRAAADVTQNMEAAREANQRQLESYGLNPADTRYGAMDLQYRTDAAAASAAAANEAARAAAGEHDAEVIRREEELQQRDAALFERQRATVDVANMGMANNLAAIGVGGALAGQAQSGLSNAGALGSSAAGVTNAATQTGASSMGTGLGWSTSANQSATGATGATSAGYAGELGAAELQHEIETTPSPWMQTLGTVAGAGTSLAMSSQKPWIFKEKGGPITPNMSPSRGAIPDDVATGLTAGEYVMDPDTVRWFGEKHFRGLQEKAQKERQALPIG